MHTEESETAQRVPSGQVGQGQPGILAMGTPFSLHATTVENSRESPQKTKNRTII